MAMFTESVMEIIQRNAGNTDITTIDGIYQVGAPIFFGSELNVISSEYRERFAKGFLLHFFNEELAFDAFPLWRIKFQEKVFNNSEYINQIYATLDKQIISDYNVKKKSGQEASRMVTDVAGNSVNQTDGKISTTDNSTTNETNSNTNTLGEQTKDTSANTVEGKGSIVDSKTGTEKIEGVGGVTRNKSGNDVISDTGVDELVNTGNRKDSRDTLDNTYIEGKERLNTSRTGADTLQKTGSDERSVTDNRSAVRSGSVSSSENGVASREATNRKYGKETSSDEYHRQMRETGTYDDKRTVKGTVTDTRKQNGEIKDNSFNVAYDTPMGSLSNLREGPGAEYIQAHEAGPSSGQGSDLISNATFNYMSAASEQGSTRAFDEYSDENKRAYSNDYEEKMTHTPNNYIRIEETVPNTTNKRDLSFENRYDELGETQNSSRGLVQNYDDLTDSIDGTTTDSMSYGSGTSSSSNMKGVDEREFVDRHNVRQLNDDGNLSYAENKKNIRDTQRNIEYGSNDVQMSNTQDEKTYDTDITRERDTLDITNSNSVGSRDVTSQDNGTRNVQDVSASTKDEDTRVENTSTTNTDATGSKTNVEDETDYNISLEMIYRSEPLLYKVWKIFDDLFMIIFE